MIPARKSKRFSAWFARHVAKRFHRTFSRIYVDGLDHLKDAAAAGPVVLVSNHTSWWDAILAPYLITYTLGLDGYAMMDADNLRRLPFFGRIGAFGVERGTHGDRAAIDYAKTLLDRPGRLVWVFAQGDERPINQRPLGFRKGAAVVACGTGTPVVTLALRYVFGAREKPELYLAFTAASAPAADLEVERGRQEAAVEASLARIEAALTGPRFAVLWRSEPSWLARLAERALAWFTRRAVRPPESGPGRPGRGDDPAT